jgi:transcriptional regulator with PAS, ATPase and Fis domain
MNSSRLDTICLINFAAIDDIILSINERRHDIKIDHLFHTDLIFDIITQGSSLSEIIQEATNQIEKCIIIHVLKRTNGNKSKAASILQINYKTLYYKIKKYCL